MTTPDIMSTLLGPYKDTKPSENDMKMLRGDSQLIVVAGRSLSLSKYLGSIEPNYTDTVLYSDTTATTLTHIFYELARNRKHIPILREEIALHIGSSDDIQDEKLRYLDHLNGVIYETLRLHPPVPTALQRLTPPEGLEIGHTHIPGNVTVWCPQYVIGRSRFCITKFFKVQAADRNDPQVRKYIKIRPHSSPNAGIPVRIWSKNEALLRRSRQVS